MTPEQRQARFLQDIQRVLDNHKAEILVTDDWKGLRDAEWSGSRYAGL